MVPAATLMYGSILSSVTRKPRASSNEPMEAAASPLPRDETTPPVTKMNFDVTEDLLLSTAPASSRQRPRARRRASARARRASDHAGVPGPVRRAAPAALPPPPRPGPRRAPASCAPRAGTIRSPAALLAGSPATPQAVPFHARAEAARRRGSTDAT